MAARRVATVWRLAMWMAIVTLVAGMTGCDNKNNNSSSTKRSVRLRPSNEPAVDLRVIHVILPNKETAEAEVWSQAARLEGAMAKASIVIHRPDNSAKQAESIKAAIDKGAEALIVMPSPKADLVEVLDQATARKIPVVLVNGGVKGLKQPVPTILSEDYIEPAKGMVAKLKNDLNFYKQATESVFLVTNVQNDLHAPDRIKALEDAAKNAGFKTIKRIQIDTSDSGNSKEVVLEAFKKEPNIHAILAEEAIGFDGATRVRIELKKGRRNIVVAGFCSFFNGLPVAEGHNCAVVYQLNPRPMVNKALAYTVRLLNGDSKVPLETRQVFLVALGDPKSEIEYMDFIENERKKPLPGLGKKRGVKEEQE